MYALLFTNINPNEDITTKKWEKELEIDLSNKDWERIFTYIHKGSLDVLAQGNGFKIYSRWYRTPDKLLNSTPIQHRYVGAVESPRDRSFKFGGIVL